MFRIATLLVALVFSPSFAPAAPPKIVLVAHGGAGVLTAEELKKEGLTKEQFEANLAKALAAGYAVLNEKGKTGVDAVEATVRILEDCDLFNAGKGAALTSEGKAELDAAIVDGTMIGSGEGKRDPRKRAGAVTGITEIKNPISAARAVMEMPNQKHAMLAGPRGEEYLLTPDVMIKFRLERVPNSYFQTERRLRQVRPKDNKQTKRDGADARFGTVGCVALDSRGSLVAGTSTGGLARKLPGRVGDTPMIGGGTYADDRACGVSCTGTGEVFLRHATAADVVGRMRHGKQTITDAVNGAIADLPDEDGGVGGLIALDKEGRAAFGMSAKSVGMYRGYVTAEGKVFVATYAGDGWREVK
jgi:beta-aspartyl-peptidase (threonine type)